MFAIKNYIYRSFLFCIFGVFIATLLVLPSAAKANGLWSIESFDAVVQVTDEATLIVEERITVDFETEKHGIFRNIPVIYRDEIGNRVTANIDVTSVKQDGEPATFTVTRIGPDKEIRIGDADTLITGQHEYEITYTVNRAILYFDDYDEVFWNVTGDDWDVPIKKSSAIVILPKGADFVQAACFTGPYGSTAEECGQAQDGEIVGFVAKDFLTVAVGFTRGVVYNPTISDKITWFFTDNWPAVFPIILIITIVVLWWKMGRDPRLHKTIIAEYEPPNGILAPYADLLLRGSISKQAISAMIIQLAVMGYILIDVKPDKKRKHVQNVTLIKLKEAGSLDPAFTQLLKMLFGNKERVTLKELRGTIEANEFGALRKKIRTQMLEDGYYTGSSFWMRTLYFVVGVMQLYAAFMLGFFFGTFAAILLAIGGISCFIFGTLMPKRTLKGAELARNVLGFKEFMHTAERYRSKWQEKENIFFTYLPYAMIFRDVDQWTQAFKDLSFKQPEWIQGPFVHTDFASFANSMTSITRSMSGAMTPKSSGSSGSSGGGFSGGGFGGGGGGSW